MNRLMSSMGFAKGKMYMSERKTWPQICQTERYQGCWIALDNCRYDETTMNPMEGEVVDADKDLSSLCSRMREAGRGSCAIHFCDGHDDVGVPSSGRQSQYPSAATN